MKLNELEKVVGSLGRSHADLVADQIIPDLVLRELYPGSERISTTLEQGLELDFLPEGNICTDLIITLKKQRLRQGRIMAIFQGFYTMKWIKTWSLTCLASQ